MDRGWVKSWRKTVDSRVWKNPVTFKVWTWCLYSASIKRRWVTAVVGKSTCEIEILPGQFLFGRKRAAEELEMPPSTVRNQIAKLVEIGCLDSKADSNGTIVTVVEWETYNGGYSENGQQRGQPVDSRRTAVGQPSDTNKKEEKGENTASTIVEACALAKKPEAPPPAKSEFSFPTRAGKLWDLSQRKFDEYDATYGEDVDLPGELRKARQWLRDNTSKRKTPGGMAAFLTRWLNRAMDSAGRHALGSRAANVSDAGAVYNPETGEIVKPLEESK